MSAVVRERVSRRLVTWRAPIVERRVYAPLPYVPRELLARRFDASILTDTAHADAAGAVPPPHPILLLDRAKTAVSRDREQAERRLAEQWCAEEDRPLLVDGGIGGSDAASVSPWVVGVVKTHRTLYAEGGALDTVLALEAGQRSSVFRIAGGERRRAVLSFYLRQRAVGGQDALWGLIRVEMAHTDQVSARADEISRWLLAERAPLAMPDARWDKMTYGVRNAEEMLRAIR